MTTLVPPVVGPVLGFTPETAGCTVPAMATCTALPLLTVSTVTLASQGRAFGHGAQPGEADGQGGGGGGGHGPGHAVAEGHGVVGRGRVEGRAGDRHARGVGGQAGGAGGHRFQLEGADVGRAGRRMPRWSGDDLPPRSSRH